MIRSGRELHGCGSHETGSCMLVEGCAASSCSHMSWRATTPTAATRQTGQQAFYQANLSLKSRAFKHVSGNELCRATFKTMDEYLRCSSQCSRRILDVRNLGQCSIHNLHFLPQHHDDTNARSSNSTSSGQARRHHMEGARPELRVALHEYERVPAASPDEHPQPSNLKLYTT